MIKLFRATKQIRAGIGRVSIPRHLLILSLLLFAGTSVAQAQTTAFSYQGRLSDGPNVANGAYQIQFSLFDAASGGTQQGATLTFDGAGANPSAITVTNGVFSVHLDFGANPLTSGANRYLEISVKKSSETSYTTLAPREQLTSSPYAVRTLSASTADSLSGACVTCVTNAQIGSVDGSKVTGTVASATNATTANNAVTATNALTAASAGNVTGIVGLANGGTGSATQNFVDLTTDQTIAGNKTFTGMLRGDGSGLRNVSGASVAGSTALNPQRLAILRWYDVNSAAAAQPITVTGPSPQALVFDGTFIYVASFDSTVTRIRASTGVIEGSPIAVGGLGTTALGFDGTFVYVATGTDNKVRRIRASTGTVENRLSIAGSSPRAMAFDGTFMYVANQGTDNVTRIRAATGLVEGDPIAVGRNPSGLAFDGTFIYVGNGSSNSVMRIRAATGMVEGSPISIDSPDGSLTFDGTFIYVASHKGTVSRIRASTGVVEGNPITVGGLPFAIVFDGTFVYVADVQNNSVSRIRASTGLVEGGPIAVGGHPFALAFDGSFIYVVNSDSGTVMRF